MIITQKKPIEEIMAMVGDAKTVAIIGCGSCATACQTGGEAQVAELAAVLEQAGKKVVATTMADYCCMNLGVKGKMKPVLAAGPDCVICMSCGDGVQCVAKNAKNIPVYPSNNTMYLGEAVRFGVWEEACHFCGECVLGQTGAICPITQCAKSLVNGPCGGAKNGKCEVNPENDCAWIKIYNRLLATGQLEKLTARREDKGYAAVAYPRTISLRGKK
jgi:NAD-dependent dihydropyrimidine dehydrogenase PreA subunit